MFIRALLIFEGAGFYHAATARQRDVNRSTHKGVNSSCDQLNVAMDAGSAWLLGVGARGSPLCLVDGAVAPAQAVAGTDPAALATKALSGK
jgi:hypothetical protein